MAQTETAHFFDSLNSPFMVFKVCFLDESELHMAYFLLFNSFLLILYHEWHENQLELILYHEWHGKKKNLSFVPGVEPGLVQRHTGSVGVKNRHCSQLCTRTLRLTELRSS